MNREQYLKFRGEKLADMQAKIGEGDVAGANAVKAEVEKLDADFEAAAKAKADFEALTKTPAVKDLAALGGKPPAGAAAAVTDMNGGGKITNESEAYLNAWAKTMMRQKLSGEERQAFDLVNEAFLHTTENTGSIVPKTVADGIFRIAAETYPLYADVAKTFVKGNVTLITEGTSGDAGWYDEDTKTDDAKETFAEVDLTGCELARRVRVSWKLQAMSIADFIPYIIRKMGEKMGAALGYGVAHGKGKPGSGESFKAEPLGIVTALEKEAGTPQVGTYTVGALTYQDITGALARLGSRFAQGVSCYANSKTVWGELANVLDGMNRPLFITNVVTEGGVGRALGALVKLDDGMADGELLFGDPGTGYHLNVNQDVTVRPFEDDDVRQTKYTGYAIVDGAPLTTKAFSLLKKASAGA